MRALVLYRVGPSWDPQRPLAEQEGVRDHLEYQVARAREGTFELSGPFVDASGHAEDLVGLALLTGDDLEEAQRAAESDPAVRGGLLRAEVLAWHV